MRTYEYSGVGSLHSGNESMGRVRYRITVVPRMTTTDTLAGHGQPMEVSEDVRGNIAFLDTPFFRDQTDDVYVLKLQDGTPVRVQVGPSLAGDAASIVIMYASDLPPRR